VAERRDREAFGQLFDHFAPKLKGYLRRQGAGDQEAEDLVQNVMLKVWHRARQFDASRGNASTWVFAIARNERISAIRRERRPEVDLNDPTLVPDPDPPADETLDRSREFDRLQGAVGGLPEEQAQVVRMSFVEDKAHSEIAAELGLPLGTVKSRIRLALGRLRQALHTEQS
jgi:RNA polymerase sigma-70 factor (ECF subfamily)